jgi:hypothetical protein
LDYSYFRTHFDKKVIIETEAVGEDPGSLDRFQYSVARIIGQKPKTGATVDGRKKLVIGNSIGSVCIVKTGKLIPVIGSKPWIISQPCQPWVKLQWGKVKLGENRILGYGKNGKKQ